MTRTRVSAYAFVVASTLAGCASHGEVEYAGQVQVASPELVEVSPGVMVIADADEPIFYSRGDYWLYRDGYWFRSHTYNRGFARVDFTIVPNEVRVIDRPQLYVHYRANMGKNRAARENEMRTRSQQQPQPRPYQQGQQYPTEPQPTQPTMPATPTQTYPSPMPNRPGANPTQPTTPPAPNQPTTVPNDNRREPQPQRNVPPDIDNGRTTAPGNSANAPGHDTDRDRGNSANAPGHENDRDATPPPGHDNPNANPGRGNSANAPGHTNTSDRPDRGTPPANTNTDDRTRKADDKKAGKDKKKNDDTY